MGDVTRVVAVTGTRREAAVLRGSGVETIALGSGSAPLEDRLVPLCAVVSFGMAGALGPDLRLGDWVIGTRTCGAFAAECDPQWRTALARQLPGARLGSCYADGHLIADSTEKKRLFQSTGALIADMESHRVAKAAASLGVPFAVLRCISDEAAHSLPPAIAVAMRPDGGIALAGILRSIIGNPSQLSDIARVVRQFAAVYSAFQATAGEIPGRLGFDLRAT